VNLYEYAEGDPVNRIDPTGNDAYVQIGGGAETSTIPPFGLGVGLGIGVVVDSNWQATPYVTGGFAPLVLGASAGAGVQAGYARSTSEFDGWGSEVAASVEWFSGAVGLDSTFHPGSGSVGVNEGPGMSLHWMGTYSKTFPGLRFDARAAARFAAKWNPAGFLLGATMAPNGTSNRDEETTCGE
jgi:hypothetical protein